jgi:hypothetical protein
MMQILCSESEQHNFYRGSAQVECQRYQSSGRFPRHPDSSVTGSAKQSAHFTSLVIMINVQSFRSRRVTADADTALCFLAFIVFPVCNSICLLASACLQLAGLTKRIVSFDAVFVMAFYAPAIQSAFHFRISPEQIGAFGQLALGAKLFGNDYGIIARNTFWLKWIVYSVVLMLAGFAVILQTVLSSSVPTKLIDGFNQFATSTTFFRNCGIDTIISRSQEPVDASLARSVSSIFVARFSGKCFKRFNSFAFATTTLLARSIAHVGLLLVRPCPRPVHAGAGVFCCLHLSYQPKWEIGGGANDACRTWI